MYICDLILDTSQLVCAAQVSNYVAENIRKLPIFSSSFFLSFSKNKFKQIFIATLILRNSFLQKIQTI